MVEKTVRSAAVEAYLRRFETTAVVELDAIEAFCAKIWGRVGWVSSAA